jgi:NTE family protein
VLSGGGARGAYQVGVLRGLVEQGLLSGERSGFDVFVGSSAGSINAAALAAHAGDLPAGVARLEEVWRTIEARQVFRTDVASLGRIGVRWAWDLSFGGATGRVGAKSLLDTTPLRSLLGRRVPLQNVRAHIAAGRLHALALIATDLHTSNGVVFLQAPRGTPIWSRRRWRIERTTIGVPHLMASSAIPVFFPSIEIGGRFYGDGAIRNTTPLSPAINLGAGRIVAIGVSGPAPAAPGRGARRAPTIAQVAGVLLDAVMLDAIEVDVEHSERVNTSVLHVPNGGPGQPFRLVRVLWLRPSQRIREIAAMLEHRVPRVLRYLMRGLGSDESVTELTSYLMFDPEFCGRLIDLGREDVARERARIAAFFGDRPVA